MSPTQSVQKNDTSEKPIVFKPFGAADEIRLSIKIVQNVIAVRTKTGRTCSERDALKFVMLCQSQRLNPFAGDAYLVGYDSRDQNGNIVPTFSLITAHQALLKRAEASADFEGMDSGIILLDEAGKVSEREGDFHLEDEKVVGGWARVYRKGRRPTYRRLAIAQRKPKYDSQFWSGNKASEQIVKTAEADALRSTFPTLVGGLYIEGERDERADHFVSEISSNGNSGGFDPKGLVETTPATASATQTQDRGQAEKEQFTDPGDDSDLAPQKAKAETAPESKLQDELSKLVLESGFTFEHLAKWGEGSGNIPDASSMPGFEAVPTDVCRRLLRARAGLLKGLKEAKGS
jgi:phage recombination protein Bet